MDEKEKNDLLKQDEAKGKLFDEFLELIDKKYKSYFEGFPINDGKHKKILHFFAIMYGSRPPYYKLRYMSDIDLDENIKDEVVKRYKEIFGKWADYEEAG